MNAVTIGPLFFATDRFAAILAIAAFLAAGEILSRKVDRCFSSWNWQAVLWFILGARLGHVVQHAGSFSLEPLRAFALWQGGFLVWTGIAAAAAFTLFFFRHDLKIALWAPLPAAAAAFIAVAIIQLTAGAPATPLPPGQFLTLDGRTIVPETLRGKPLVINLWATWCPPCRREMPMMADVAAMTGDVTFVFVNQGEGADAVGSYMASEGIALETVLLDSLGLFGRHYAAPGLPATLFIGGDGKLRSIHMGEISREKLAEGIEALQDIQGVPMTNASIRSLADS